MNELERWLNPLSEERLEFEGVDSRFTQVVVIRYHVRVSRLVRDLSDAINQRF